MEASARTALSERLREARGGDELARRRPVEGRRCRAIWLSDVHLGTPLARTKELVAFLRSHRSEVLYLVGDFLDGWSLRRRWRWTRAEEEVLQTVRDLSEDGVRVVYLRGNHDDFLRSPEVLGWRDVELVDECEHRTRGGRRLLVVHGHQFDRILRTHPRLVEWGDRARQRLLRWGRGRGRGRGRAVREAGSAAWTVNAAHAVRDFFAPTDGLASELLAQVRERGLGGAVYGHTHRPSLTECGDQVLVNTGDWVENRSALIEECSGRLSLVEWAGTLV